MFDIDIEPHLRPRGRIANLVETLDFDYFDKRSVGESMFKETKSPVLPQRSTVMSHQSTRVDVNSLLSNIE